LACFAITNLLGTSTCDFIDRGSDAWSQFTAVKVFLCNKDIDDAHEILVDEAKDMQRVFVLKQFLTITNP
jgi:hypothetical protein